MNTDGTGFHTWKECHKTESLWNHTTTDHKEGEQSEDRRSAGASSCNWRRSGSKGSILYVYDDDDEHWPFTYNDNREVIVTYFKVLSLIRFETAWFFKNGKTFDFYIFIRQLYFFELLWNTSSTRLMLLTFSLRAVTPSRLSNTERHYLFL